MRFNISPKIGFYDEETREEFLDEIGLRGCPEYGSHIGGNYAITEGMFVLMQSTGICDINDKEIFESDIVKCDSKFIGSVSSGVVTWSLGSWIVQNFKQNSNMPVAINCDDLLVLGNIFENSELNYKGL